MSTKEYSSPDYQGLPIINWVLETLGATPSAPATGVRLYWDSAAGDAKAIFASGTVRRITVANIADADVASNAAIQEAKLALASDAAYNVASRRTLGTGAQQALAGTTRLDQIANPLANVSFNGQRAINAADPQSVQDLTTMSWVQNLVSSSINGHDWKDAAFVAVSTNVNIASPGATLDGQAMSANDPRVLLYGQTDGTQNGLWTWNGAASAMSRTTDADQSSEVTSGMTVPITNGTRANAMAVLTTPDPITLGTTSLTFTFLATGGTYTAGTGISISGNVISLSGPVSIANGGTGASTASGARTALGVPQRGFAADVPALTAGSAANIAHGLGTADLTIAVYDKTSGRDVEIEKGRDSTNITLVSQIAVAASALRVVAVPVA